MLRPNYDEETDTLYLKVGDNSHSYCSEVINNVNVFRDMVSEEITGFMIFAFMEKYQNGTLPSLPYFSHISLERDVAPILNSCAALH